MARAPPVADITIGSNLANQQDALPGSYMRNYQTSIDLQTNFIQNQCWQIIRRF